MQVEIKPLTVADRSGDPRDSGQDRVIVDGKPIGFVGRNNGEGVRVHVLGYGDKLDEILEQVRQIRPDQEIPTIIQCPGIQKPKQQSKAANLT